MRGRLGSRYLQIHPNATIGLDACRFFEKNAARWFRHAEVKRALGCSDRIIREHLPTALNTPELSLLETDKSHRAWRYRYPGRRP